ncbi:HesB/YadR/YfhF family protein [Bacillus sp. HNG]|nr:HesB/YadR/YfhF family protein [Bacillus sp. HNG]
MEMTISDAALKWFKEDISVKKGDSVRFYPMFYGTSPVQEKYSLAFSTHDEPIQIHTSQSVDEVMFYVEEDDIWFFNGHNLIVDYNPDKDELEYQYPKP